VSPQNQLIVLRSTMLPAYLLSHEIWH